MARDTILRNYFVKKGTAKVGSAIQTDMDLLDISDSEGEDEDSMDCDVYNEAIQTLLTINWTNSL